MAFLAYCTNRGCGKFQEPFLDPNTNDVICSECNGVINNITQFTKNQLKSMGQVRKPVKQAYAILCGKCKNNELPNIDKNNKLVCKTCSSQLNISGPFESLVRDAIKKGKQDL